MLDQEFISWIKTEVIALFACQKGLNIPTFKTMKGGHHCRKKPDYIFKTSKGIWGCIEYEPGESYGQITKGATQLNDIYILIKNGQYFEIQGGIKIIPTLFLLATKYSQKGYLWKNDPRVNVEYSGYSENEEFSKQNSTVFHATRWMWRFCGREENIFSETNPIGVSKFSVIYSNWNKKPEIELNGKYKFQLRDL